MSLKIGILDYGAGNIRSVQNSLKRLGQDSFVSSDPKELGKADKIIFPGVGNAGFVMTQLRDKGLDKFLKQCQKPVLGICLGMQLLFDYSAEDETECLGIMTGRVQKFDAKKCPTIPHISWNVFNKQLAINNEQLLKNISQNSFVYFVHSYFVPICKNTIAECFYGERFSAAVRKNNFWGTQFHPEKSGDVGSQILQNFLNI